jgi:hypothetical protein
MNGEKRVHGTAQLPNASPVDDADLKDSSGLTSGQVCQDGIFHVLGSKRVQVEHAIKRQFDRLEVGLLRVFVVHVTIEISRAQANFHPNVGKG